MNRKAILLVTTAAALVVTFIVRRSGLGKPRVPDLALPDKEALMHLGTTMRDVREATLAAFTQHPDDAEFTKDEMAARVEFSKLQASLADVRDTIPGEVRDACDRFVELATEAQLQLMAFAINRKNRGTPDSAQEEAEAHDRKQFRTGVAELNDRLVSAFHAVGVAVA